MDLNKFKNMIKSRRAIYVAGGIGIIFAAITIARRNNASSDDASLKMGVVGEGELVGYTAQVPTFAAGSDSGFNDSQNDMAILQYLSDLEGSLMGIESDTLNLNSVIASVQGEQAAQRAMQGDIKTDTQIIKEQTRPTVAKPPAGGGNKAVNLPRWTPPANITKGAKTDIAGATFAGRIKLSNGQFAPMIKYANGTTVIHPSWQRWMKANNVRKAA